MEVLSGNSTQVKVTVIEMSGATVVETDPHLVGRSRFAAVHSNVPFAPYVHSSPHVSATWY